MQSEGVGDRWYVVTVGPRVGLFRDWLNVGPIVLGHAQAVYCKVDSREEGLRRLSEAIDKGTVRTLR